MKFGFVLPSGDAHLAAEYAQQAESAGWDGFFVWEQVWGFDAWVSLTAAAMRTGRIRLGTMLSPLSRMRPWKLASETLNLDRLSDGRVILSVGLGAPESGFHWFGEITDRKKRAELLDEGLEVLTRLWRGQPFDYDGKHYHVHITQTPFPPLPPATVQQPRIPIWVVGAWPSRRSIQRALRYDGLLPNILGPDGKVRMSPPTVEEIQQISAYVHEQITEYRPYDIVVEGKTPGDRPAEAADIVRPYAAAGATWWIEALWDASEGDAVLQRIQQGPPPIP